MREILYSFLLTGFSLLGQSTHEDPTAVSRLKISLTALQSGGANRMSLAEQLVDVIMSLGEGERRPSRATVQNFVDELVGTLIGRNLTNAQLGMVQNSITEVLRGSTTNSNSASHLREPLAGLHVDASRMQVLTKLFVAIGEEVRGPDDSPLRGNK